MPFSTLDWKAHTKLMLLYMLVDVAVKRIACLKLPALSSRPFTSAVHLHLLLSDCSFCDLI